MVGFFAGLAGLAIRRKQTVIFTMSLVILAAIPGLWRLRLNTDGNALVTATAPEVLYDKAIRAKFGIEDQIVVLIRSAGPGGVFNPGTLQLVKDLTAEFAKLPGINPEHVLSLATEPSFRMRPGTLIHETLLEPTLKTPAELDQLRDDLRRIELYNSTVVSTNGKATVILVGVPAGSDRAQLHHQMVEILARKKNRPEELAVTGAPVAESLLGIHILEDLGVPRALLGTSTRPAKAEAGWKLPGSFYELRLLIAQRLGLVPLAILVMMLIFLISFRSVPAMLLPLPGVGATILFVFGLMGWVGVPVYLTIAVMPVLLTATGVTNDIYLFSRYFTLLRERPDGNPAELLRETFDKMAGPVAATSLTAAIGFFSFTFSPLGPVKAFGVFTGIGVLFGLIFSFTVVPAMLAMIRPQWLVSKGRAQKPETTKPSPLPPPPIGLGKRHGKPAEGLAGWFGWFAAMVVRRRWWVAGLVTLIIAATPLGLRRLVVQDSWTEAFDPDSEFRRATQRVNEEFYGMHLLFVSFDLPATLRGKVGSSALTRDGIVLPGDLVERPELIAGSAIVIRGKEAEWRSHIEMVFPLGTNIGTRIPRRDVTDSVWERISKAEKVSFEVTVHSQVRPEIIKTIADLGSFIRERRQYAVGGVLSPADYLSTTRFMARPNDPEARVLPDDPGEIKLMWDYYGLARGPHRLHQIVDTNYWQSLTTVFLKDANFVDTAKLMSDIREYEREHLTPMGIKLGFAGDVALSQSLIQGIVRTQLRSLIWSLAGIFAVTSLLGRSWRWGFYCVLPSIAAVVIKFAVMGWAGIPLGVATSMFAAMTLGIGVNCAIQLLEAYDVAQATGVSSAEALSSALKSTGPAALVNTIAVSAGFGVLMLSQVPANARLGFLVVLGLGGCLVATLLILPVMLRWWPLRRLDC